MKIRKVVIPAAGLGTRFLPATKAQPKEMLPIVDKPTIQYIVEEAIASGIESILIITGRGKRAIEDHFDTSVELELELEKKGKDDVLKMVREISGMIDVYYVRQKEPLGLGHAISCAQEFIGNEPFGIMLGDDIVTSKTPALKQLMDVYERVESSVVGVQKVGMDAVDKYGIVAPKNDEGRLHQVADLVEKPNRNEAPSDLAILGRYIITPSIFEKFKTTPLGKGGELQLTDALVQLLADEPIYAYEFEGRRYDVGDKMGFLQATVEFALEREDLAESFRTYLRDLVKGI